MTSFPRAPNTYDPIDQERLREALRRALAEPHKKNHDVEVGGGRLILTSANGARWTLTVSNAGALLVSAV